jgi:hypothetical protein
MTRTQWLVVSTDPSRPPVAGPMSKTAALRDLSERVRAHRASGGTAVKDHHVVSVNYYQGWNKAEATIDPTRPIWSLRRRSFGRTSTVRTLMLRPVEGDAPVRHVIHERDARRLRLADGLDRHETLTRPTWDARVKRWTTPTSW